MAFHYFSQQFRNLLAAMLMASGGLLPAQTAAEAESPLPKELISVKPGTWRSETVFTHAIWRDLLFYGGGSGSGGGDPRHEMEIGVFHLNTPDSGRHDHRNPVVTRSQFDLDGPGRGITPLSIIETGGRLFMFCTARPDDDLMPRIVVIETTVEDPYSWKNMTVVIDQGFSGEVNNHGASALVDPENPDQMLLYFSALTPPAGYRILLATVPLDRIMDPAAYRLLTDYKHAVIKRQDAKTNYPFVRFHEGRYELYYSGQSIPDRTTRSGFLSISDRKDLFQPSDRAIFSATGIKGRNDRAYATGPAVHGSHYYYSGRMNADGPYRGIFVMKAPAP